MNLKNLEIMRKIDWTDYRQALEANGQDTAKAVNSLQGRWSLDEIAEARKEYESRAKNPEIQRAMMEENSHYLRGNPVNRQILEENGQAIADVIKAGSK